MGSEALDPEAQDSEALDRVPLERLMVERGRLYRWPRNRPFGDSKARPVLVVSISRDPRLVSLALAVPLPATPAPDSTQLCNGLAPHHGAAGAVGGPAHGSES